MTKENPSVTKPTASDFLAEIMNPADELEPIRLTACPVCGEQVAHTPVEGDGAGNYDYGYWYHTTDITPRCWLLGVEE
jgi:hypothetical protein